MYDVIGCITAVPKVWYMYMYTYIHYGFEFLITRDLLLCLYTLNGCYIVAGDVSFSPTLHGASKPPVTITVVDNLEIFTYVGRECVCECVMVCV
jgi:hypothetical protein